MIVERGPRILYGRATSTSRPRCRSDSRSRGVRMRSFRWDLFNQFNHPGFGFPNATIDNPTAGRISTTIVDNRSMQFALKVNF